MRNLTLLERLKRMNDRDENIPMDEKDVFDDELDALPKSPEPTIPVISEPVIEKTEILKMAVVVDGTPSFSTVYPKIYYGVKVLFEKLRREKKNFPSLDVQYALILCREADYSEVVRFPSSGAYFTTSEYEMLDSLKNMQFYAGSPDGREDLNGALDLALKVLNEQPGSHQELILFSDSMPDADRYYVDFSSKDQKGYYNRGLSFARFYTYTDDYNPSLLMVDPYSNQMESTDNEAEFYSIRMLADMDMDELKEHMEMLAEDLIRQASDIY